MSPKIDWAAVFIFAVFLGSLIGIGMALATDNPWWLLLLLPGVLFVT